MVSIERTDGFTWFQSNTHMFTASFNRTNMISTEHTWFHVISTEHTVDPVATVAELGTTYQVMSEDLLTDRHELWSECVPPVRHLY